MTLHLVHTKNSDHYSKLTKLITFSYKNSIPWKTSNIMS